MAKRQAEGIKVYFGIADSDGIEAFLEWDDKAQRDINYMSLRCQFNTHRDAVIYRACLYPDDVNLIKNALADNEFKKALLILKRSAVSIELPAPVESSERKWNQIPRLTTEEIPELEKLLNLEVKLEEQSVSQLNLF